MAVTSEKVEAKKFYPYTWQGINRKGQKVSGEMQGENPNQVKAELRKQGVNVSRISRKSQSILSKYSGRIKAMDIAMISRQIATMLSAGVPLVQTLRLLSSSHEKTSVRDLLASICAEVESGIPLSQALKKHPIYFDALYCDLVAAGEQSGALEQIYDRIATYREKAEALKSKIKKALMYPAAVMCVAIIVTVILLLFVVPQFEEVFKSFGAELPAFTQMVIKMSRFMKSAWYIIFGAVGLAIFLFVRAHRSSQKVRDETDKAMLKLPIIGMILHKACLARFSSTLSTTFAAGIPLVDAMVSAAGASGNALYRDAVMAVRNEVMAGMQMHIAMRTVEVFPDMVTQMVMIGEESGSIDDMLNKIAGIYSQQVDDAVDGLSSLIEPLIMVILGVLVGGLVVAMYLPIFQLGSVVS